MKKHRSLYLRLWREVGVLESLRSVNSNTIELRFQMSSPWTALSSVCVIDEFCYRFRSRPHNCVLETKDFRWRAFAETAPCPDYSFRKSFSCPHLNAWKHHSCHLHMRTLRQWHHLFRKPPFSLLIIRYYSVFKCLYSGERFQMHAFTKKTTKVFDRLSGDSGWKRIGEYGF